MRKQAIVIRVMAAVIAAGVFAMAPSSAAQIGVARKILLQQDLTIPGYEVVLVEVTIAVGGREGKHLHGGTLVGHILEGELTLVFDNKPTKTLKAGESLVIDPQQVHEGINNGKVPVKALVTFIVEKGKALTTPLP